MTGLVAALLVRAPEEALVAGVLGAVAGGMVTVALSTDGALGERDRGAPLSLAALALGGIRGAVAAVALSGIASVSGLLALAVLLLAIATSPRVLARWLPSSPEPDLRPRTDRTDRVDQGNPIARPELEALAAGAAYVDEPDQLPNPRAMTDAELCLEWRRSYLVVMGARTPTRRSRVAQRRQALLDELEQRHPQAFRAWLESGARAASNPERFLTGPSRQPLRRREDLPPAA